MIRKFTAAALAAASLSLAACGGQGDDAAGDNVADQYDAKADNMEAAAENATNDMREEALEENASALREAGEEREEAIDEADVQVNQR